MLNKKVLIVGAGISGLTMAILLGNLGYKVTIVEKRKKNDVLFEDERSVNLTISKRGLKVLQVIGIDKNVIEKSCRLNSRIVHISEHLISRHYYTNVGRDSYLWSIKRSDLILELLRKASELENIKIIFDVSLINIDLVGLKSFFYSDTDNNIVNIDFDFIVGADGSYSKIRNYVIARSASSFEIKFFEWGYKKVTISKEDSIKMNLNVEALHVWSGKNSSLFALPNLDSSFSCIYCMSLPVTTPLYQIEVKDYLIQQAKVDIPSLYNQYPSIKDSFDTGKFSSIPSTKISKWFYGDKIVLIGDACRSVFPFYGQGMNAALEDCICLYNYLKQSEGNLIQSFTKYENKQKPNADALTELSEKHFYSLQKSSRSILYESKFVIDNLLNRLFCNKWHNPHSLVSDGEIEYKDIKKVLSRQNLLRSLSCVFVLDLFLTIYTYFKRIGKSCDKILKRVS